MRIIWKHILRAHLAPFLFSLCVLMAIFILQFIMKFMDQLVGKGLSAGVIVEVIVLNLSWMVVLAVPMSVLVATLMAFGGMSSSNEITAMRAGGLSLYRMIAPVFIVSLLICFLLIRFNNDVLPDANHKAKVLSSDIYRKKPTLSIIPGLFSQDIGGYTILVRRTFEHSNDLEGVTIFDHTKPDVASTVTANRGTISFSPDYRKLIMDLYGGEIHETNIQTQKSYRTIRFTKHRIAMNADGFDFQRSQESAFSRGDRELSAQDMRERVDSIITLEVAARKRISTIVGRDLDGLRSPNILGSPLVGKPDEAGGSALSRIMGLRNTLSTEHYRLEEMSRKRREYLVEIYKKYAIPVACIVFVLIGAPLGIMARRGTFGVAASLSLGFFLLYWASLIGGEKLADRGLIEPWLGMWMANIILGGLGLYLTFISARENITIDWTRLKQLIPRYWRYDTESPEHQ
ncbi:MAG: YjgP/YjgQ family permease [Ignavibacteria bacterium]|nr:YjgP/YjgQ family permease [Ignavibacteria bacterium]